MSKRLEKYFGWFIVANVLIFVFASCSLGVPGDNAMIWMFLVVLNAVAVCFFRGWRQFACIVLVGWWYFYYVGEINAGKAWQLKKARLMKTIEDKQQAESNTNQTNSINYQDILVHANK